MSSMSLFIRLLALAVVVSGFLRAESPRTPGVEELQRMRARFVPVDIDVDLSRLPPSEREALRTLIEAARIFDALFLRQADPLNETRLQQLIRDDSALGRARLQYFRLNAGPWSALDEDEPFLPGVGTKSLAGNFYPADVTRAEVDAWISGLPEKEKAQATGFFTTIRRGPDGGFMAVPYSVEYQGELAAAAARLREAAEVTTQPTLKAYLEKRADAFLSNDYYPSDVAWMELDSDIEPTIGPYEVYADGWFNYKAAFEAFIAVVDPDETAKLAQFGARLQELEDNLPIDPKFRRPKLGGYSPIRVVNLVFASGDANHGVQTAAFNLPNDERVVAAKGSKRVLLRNIQQAKFDRVLVPISAHVLRKTDRERVAFESFFTHILMHELMHGLGPQTIKVAGRETTVRKELKELYGTIEEAKADISGLWALQYLMERGVLDDANEQTLYTTFLASAFRTLRFGLSEAHAKGMALQLNWLREQGAVIVTPDDTFAIDFTKIKAAVTALTRELLTIQATGDYDGAKALLERMVVLTPEVARALDALKDVPVDIEPRYLAAQ